MSKLRVMACGVVAVLFGISIGGTPDQVFIAFLLALCYGQLGEILDLLERKL